MNEFLNSKDPQPARGEGPGTVDIVRMGLPALIRKLRSDRQLTQSQLANKAGLTYRTVHDLESGRRVRAQEQTLILLAKALDLTYEELLEGFQHRVPSTDAHSARPRHLGVWLAVVLVVVVFLVGSLLVRSTSASRAYIQVDGGTVSVMDGLLHNELWRSVANSNISVCERSPRSDRVLLLGRRGNAHDGGSLEARSLATGKIQWSYTPELAPAIAAFGPEVMSTGRMGCSWAGPIDMDGDGHSEILALFGHSLYYPNCLARLDAKGRILNTYWCRGAIYDVLAIDVDNDSKDEAYLCGTYNSPAYQGATIIVLDEDHFRGVAVDTSTSGSALPDDGSLLRVIYPHFPEPLMSALEISRIEIRELETQLMANQRVQFIARAGTTTRTSILTLNPDLRILEFGISDDLAVQCSRIDSLPGSVTGDHTAWVLPWLKTRVRISKGFVDGSIDPAFTDSSLLP